MPEKSYPVIIQTWLKGRGSVLLHGSCTDGAAIRWAKKEVLRWNEQRRPKEGERIWQKSIYGNYRLIGLLKHGGMEDFGRPFTEIRAVLVDEIAKIEAQNELETKLLSVVMGQDAIEDQYQITLPIIQPRAMPIYEHKNESHPDAQAKSPQSIKSRYFLYVFVLLIAIVTAIGYAISKHEFPSVPSEETAKPVATQNKIKTFDETKGSQDRTETQGSNHKQSKKTHNITWHLEYPDYSIFPNWKEKGEERCEVYVNRKKINNGDKFIFKYEDTLELHAKLKNEEEEIEEFLEWNQGENRNPEWPYSITRDETISVKFVTTIKFQKYCNDLRNWIKQSEKIPIVSKDYAEAKKRENSHEDWKKFCEQGERLKNIFPDLWAKDYQDKIDKAKNTLSQEQKIIEQGPPKFTLTIHVKPEEAFYLLQLDNKEKSSSILLQLDNKEKSSSILKDLNGGKYTVFVYTKPEYKWKEKQENGFNIIENNDNRSLEGNIDLQKETTITLNAEKRLYPVTYEIEYPDYKGLFNNREERCKISVNGEQIKDGDSKKYEHGTRLTWKAEVKKNGLEEWKRESDIEIKGKQTVKITFSTTKKFEDFKKFIDDIKLWYEKDIHDLSYKLDDDIEKVLTPLQDHIKKGKEFEKQDISWGEKRWDSSYHEKMKKAKSKLENYFKKWADSCPKPTSDDYNKVLTAGKDVSLKLEKWQKQGDVLKKIDDNAEEKIWQYEDKLKESKDLLEKEKKKFELAERIKKISESLDVKNFKEQAVNWSKIHQNVKCILRRTNLENSSLGNFGPATDFKSKIKILSAQVKKVNQKTLWELVFMINLEELFSNTNISGSWNWIKEHSAEKIEANFEISFPNIEYIKVSMNSNTMEISIDSIQLDFTEEEKQNLFLNSLKSQK